MRRRHFLRLTGLGALGGAALPLLGGCAEKGAAVRPPPPGDTDRPKLPRTALASEVASADAVGKPTLVLVIPEDDQSKWLYGTYFGVTLHTGGGVLLRELATVHVVCATTAEIAEVAALPEPGVAYLISRGGDAWTAQAIGGVVPERPNVHYGMDEEAQTADDLYRAWVAPFRDALVGAVAGDEDVVRARAARVRNLLGDADRERVDACLTGSGTPDAALIGAAAAVFRADDYFSTRDEDRWTSLLADSARKAVIDSRIPGAHWATNQGCGHTVDDLPVQLQPACGMGYVPDSGRRFLWLYTADDRG